MGFLQVMAKYLAQSPIVPALLTSRSHGPSKKRSVKMMCSLQTPGLRIRSFSGLHGSNSLDNMVSLGQDFRYKVAISLGRGTRYWHCCKSHKSMEINLKDARVEVEKIIGRGNGFVDVEILFTPRAKHVLELSTRQLGLAQRIASGDVTDTIEGKKVITLHTGLLVAGTKYRGEFEEILKKLMEEIKQSDEIILFIDEGNTLIGAGAAEGAIDAANILKPALARGELQVNLVL
ncbi:hypothetical protein V6N11_080427 [Hibiscus sabdariffa]|uniref:Uncharacterized protein n=1 Tax=Hibiscus sabdariffa TaxID=183260 RepID=A0ABR2R7N6_9ROSI